jgi:hypothetical protein
MHQLPQVRWPFFNKLALIALRTLETFANMVNKGSGFDFAVQKDEHSQVEERVVRGISA